MKPIERWQMKSIYALGADAGMTAKDQHDDNLHQLVAGLTGKDSIAALTFDEASAVITELKERMRGHFRTESKPKAESKESRPAGGMAKGQQAKVWQLMYTLAEYDSEHSTATLGTRLCGIIKRQLGIDVSPKQPFRWLSYKQGSQLIEILKKYVSSAEQRRDRERAL